MKNRRAYDWKICLLLILFAAILSSPILGASSKKESPQTLVEFYVVEVGEADFYPYWNSTILHAMRHESGVRVQYTSITSATMPCDDPKLSSTSVIMPNTRLEDLTNDLALCSLDASQFNQNADKYLKDPEAFDTVRSAVVARCGAEERVFKMPKFKMNMMMLKQIEPSIERMAKLYAFLQDKAFPVVKTNTLSWDENHGVSQIQPESTQFEELRSGRFDKAYWFAFEGARPMLKAQAVISVNPVVGLNSDIGILHRILANYHHLARSDAGRTGTLLDSEGYKLKQYVAPIYPLYAVRAHIEGKSVLSLKVDHATGLVEQVDVISGKELFKESIAKAARQWQFDPSQQLPEQMKVVLDFSVNCGD